MKNIIPAVDRTLCILEMLSRTQNGLTQQQIVKSSGVSTTTGYRILQTLLAHGWIERGISGSYFLTGAIPGRSNALQNMLEHAQAILDILAQKTLFSSKLSIREGEKQVSILRADSPAPFALTGKTGSKFPLIEGSVGAVLISELPKAEIIQLVRKESEDIPEKTDPAIIFDRIKRLKKNGWVANMSPSRWKVQAMSVPVRIEGSVRAALTLIGLRDDFDSGKTEKLAEALKLAQIKLENSTGE